MKLTRESISLVSEMLSNGQTVQRVKFKTRMSTSRINYAYYEIYRGYIKPSVETTVVTIPSIINFDEEYYEKLFNRFNERKDFSIKG